MVYEGNEYPSGSETQYEYYTSSPVADQISHRVVVEVG